MRRLRPAERDAEEKNLPTIIGETTLVPAFIAAGGERAAFAFIDFFTAQIRNRNTRAAYAVAVRSFCSWAEATGTAEFLEIVSPTEFRQITDLSVVVYGDERYKLPRNSRKAGCCSTCIGSPPASTLCWLRDTGRQSGCTRSVFRLPR